MGNVQIGDGWHRGYKGGEPARQRIPCEVPAATPVPEAQRRQWRAQGPRFAHSLGARTKIPRGSRAYVAERSKLALEGWGGDRLSRACGSYCESTRAHIDESRRSRVMVSGNWPVKFCPLRSLHDSALTVGCTDSNSTRANTHARYPADAPQVAQCHWHRADKQWRCAR